MSVSRFSTEIVGILQCRYSDPENKQLGRIWVRYGGGHEAPLEPRLCQGSMDNLGCVNRR